MSFKNILKGLSVWDFLGLLFILILNLYLKLPPTLNGFFAFTYDQGRDLLQVAKIVYDHTPTLIGPTTGLGGIFYGPWWYYFLSPILLLSGGNPQIVAIWFVLIGIATILTLFFFTKSQTSTKIAFTIALIATLSRSWMLAPTIIWSTALTPILMIAAFYLLLKTYQKQTKINLFLLAALSFLVMDAEVPWGICWILFLILLALCKRTFLKRNFIFAIFGGFIIIFPRILFEIKHSFLMTNTVVAYLKNPPVYGERETFVFRLLDRIDIYFGLFSQSFTQGNKAWAAFLLLAITILTAMLLKGGVKLFKKERLLITAAAFLAFSLLFFSFYKDRVWEYYLIGLPITYILIISTLVKMGLEDKTTKIYTLVLGILILILNINFSVLKPFKITWLGDNATYRNQILAMDYIASQKPTNYSYFAYTPAFFDYPFDYLFYWYSKTGRLETPKKNQNVFYLIIRNASNHEYLAVGWYGDKTQDKTKIIDAKTFPGDLLVEKHIKNEAKN
ncbi:hypothetical protein HY024_05210 [Candidatus Curtissbacteria bacterium]|nr:hypothetical protein [Candidatus Curtissbacteria bacterium]